MAVPVGVGVADGSVLVGGAVAVVVQGVADLGRARMHGGVGVVTIVRRGHAVSVVVVRCPGRVAGVGVDHVSAGAERGEEGKSGEGQQRAHWVSRGESERTFPEARSDLSAISHRGKPRSIGQTAIRHGG